MNISVNDISNIMFNSIENKNKYPIEKIKLLLHKYSEQLKQLNDDKNNKQNMYFELIESPRIIQNNLYNKFLEERTELYNIYKKEKSKESLYNLLNKSFDKYTTIPEIYTSSVFRIKKPKLIKEKEPIKEQQLAKIEEVIKKEENIKVKGKKGRPPKVKEEIPKEKKRGRPPKVKEPEKESEEEPKEEPKEELEKELEKEPKEKPKEEPEKEPKEEPEKESEEESKEESEEEPKEKSNNELRCSIKNLGQTCYINSALQMLIHTKLFNDILLKNKKHNKIVEEYLKLYDAYINKKNVSKYILPLLNKLNEKLIENDKFNIDIQSDSSEFLNKLIEKINLDDVNKLFNVNIKTEYKVHDIKVKDKEYMCDESKTTNTEETSLNLYFEDIDKIYNLKEEIENKFNGVNEEILEKENYIDCDKIINKNTKRKTKLNIKFPYTKTEIVDTFPTILRINLNIFDNNLSKVFYKTNIPNIINCKDNKYKLYGIVVHEGKTSNTGHYKYFSNENNIWVEYSDNDIKIYKKQKHNIKKPYYELNTDDKEFNIFRSGDFIASPYMLFYIKNDI